MEMKTIDMGVHKLTQEVSLELEYNGIGYSASLDVEKNIDTDTTTVTMKSILPPIGKSENRKEIIRLAEEHFESLLLDTNSVQRLIHNLHDLDLDENIVYQYIQQQHLDCKTTKKEWEDVCETCNSNMDLLDMPQFIIDSLN